MKMVQETNYDKMEKLGIIQAVHDLADSENDSYARFQAEGTALVFARYMDLIVEVIGKKNDKVLVSMAHYYQQNGDSVPDPEMEILVDFKYRMAHAISFSNAFGMVRSEFQEGDGGVLIDPRAKKKNDAFLGKWLSNLKQQGFKLKAVE